MLFAGTRNKTELELARSQSPLSQVSTATASSPQVSASPATRIAELQAELELAKQKQALMEIEVKRQEAVTQAQRDRLEREFTTLQLHASPEDMAMLHAQADQMLAMQRQLEAAKAQGADTSLLARQLDEAKKRQGARISALKSTSNGSYEEALTHTLDTKQTAAAMLRDKDIRIATLEADLRSKEDHISLLLSSNKKTPLGLDESRLSLNVSDATLKTADHRSTVSGNRTPSPAPSGRESLNGTLTRSQIAGGSPTSTELSVGGGGGGAIVGSNGGGGLGSSLYWTSYTPQFGITGLPGNNSTATSREADRLFWRQMAEYEKTQLQRDANVFELFQRKAELSEMQHREKIEFNNAEAKAGQKAREVQRKMTRRQQKIEIQSKLNHVESVLSKNRSGEPRGLGPRLLKSPVRDTSDKKESSSTKDSSSVPNLMAVEMRWQSAEHKLRDNSTINEILRMKAQSAPLYSMVVHEAAAAGPPLLTPPPPFATPAAAVASPLRSAIATAAAVLPPGTPLAAAAPPGTPTAMAAMPNLSSLTPPPRSMSPHLTMSASGLVTPTAAGRTIGPPVAPQLQSHPAGLPPSPRERNPDSPPPALHPAGGFTVTPAGGGAAASPPGSPRPSLPPPPPTTSRPADQLLAEGQAKVKWSEDGRIVGVEYPPAPPAVVGVVGGGGAVPQTTSTSTTTSTTTTTTTTSTSSSSTTSLVGGEDAQQPQPGTDTAPGGEKPQHPNTTSQLFRGSAMLMGDTVVNTANKWSAAEKILLQSDTMSNRASTFGATSPGGITMGLSGGGVVGVGSPYAAATGHHLPHHHAHHHSGGVGSVGGPAAAAALPTTNMTTAAAGGQQQQQQQQLVRPPNLPPSPHQALMAGGGSPARASPQRTVADMYAYPVGTLSSGGGGGMSPTGIIIDRFGIPRPAAGGGASSPWRRDPLRAPSPTTTAATPVLGTPTTSTSAGTPTASAAAGKPPLPPHSHSHSHPQGLNHSATSSSSTPGGNSSISTSSSAPLFSTTGSGGGSSVAVGTASTGSSGTPPVPSTSGGGGTPKASAGARTPTPVLPDVPNQVKWSTEGDGRVVGIEEKPKSNNSSRGGTPQPPAVGTPDTSLSSSTSAPPPQPPVLTGAYAKHVE